MTDTEEVERLKNALVEAEESLADAQKESENRLSEIEALRRALKYEERARAELQARIGIPTTVRNTTAHCHSCGATIVTADDGSEARIRQLEARIAELASESSANETGYLHECNRSSAFESEAEDLRKQLDTARQTLVGISGARLEDWQALLERADKAEARVQHLEGRIALAEGDDDLFLCDAHDKAVCDAVEAVPDDLLHEWTDLIIARSGRLTVIARAELARREARRAGGAA